ncbi:hypothetical protein JD844_017163 [Phrynosoma platyrhinos]|uniref:Mitochondrial genome maintenance exonuclease 1 n=1 Tax=Phrynosoma platyrhinos TaxID=52577 RepID=A0ABQ7SLM3_PHRPL|nr:hypothetical protein JD844_017163 [Phrynosoma platyrhinos]
MLSKGLLNKDQFLYRSLANSFPLYGKKKRISEYENTDQEKYGDLIRDLVSCKDSFQRPESLFVEHDMIYGHESKYKPPLQEAETKLNGNGIPLMNPNIFRQGKCFHAAMENLLLGDDIPVKEQGEDPDVSGFVKSVKHVLQGVTGVRAFESAVQHETLHYQGLVDCVAEYRIHREVDCGLLVIAYKDGSPAHPHYMDSELCSQYWKKWLCRLEEYKEKRKGSETIKSVIESFPTEGAQVSLHLVVTLYVTVEHTLQAKSFATQFTIVRQDITTDASGELGGGGSETGF